MTRTGGPRGRRADSAQDGSAIARRDKIFAGHSPSPGGARSPQVTQPTGRALHIHCTRESLLSQGKVGRKSVGIELGYTQPTVKWCVMTRGVSWHRRDFRGAGYSWWHVRWAGRRAMSVGGTWARRWGAR